MFINRTHATNLAHPSITSPTSHSSPRASQRELRSNGIHNSLESHEFLIRGNNSVVGTQSCPALRASQSELRSNGNNSVVGTQSCPVSPSSQPIKFYLHRFPGFDQVSNDMTEEFNPNNNCPICDSHFLDHRGTIVCQNCGAELGPEITTRPDAIYSSEQTSQCNTVHNPLLNQFNYTTQIAGGDSQLKRLNKWSHTSYLEKTLAREFKNLEEICHQSHLSASLAQTAQILYKEVIDAFLKKAETKKRPVGLHLACLYQACKQAEITRSHRELAQICGVNESRVIRSCKIYLELVDKRTSLEKPDDTQNPKSPEIPDDTQIPKKLENPKKLNSQLNSQKIINSFVDLLATTKNSNSNSNSNSHSNSKESPIITETSTIDAYLNRFVDAVGLKQSQINLVKDTLEKIKKIGMLHESPPSIVAGTIYWVSIIHNFHIDKSVIAEQTGISEVTIVKVYKNLRPFLNQLI